jgi:hypothetical protein
MKTIYVVWDGQSNPVKVDSSVTATQIVQNHTLKARLGLPDDCIPVYNGVQDYNGPIPDGATIQVISRPAQKAIN